MHEKREINKNAQIENSLLELDLSVLINLHAYMLSNCPPSPNSPNSPNGRIFFGQETYEESLDLLQKTIRNKKLQQLIS